MTSYQKYKNYQKEYSQRKEVKARKREYYTSEEQKEKRRIRDLNRYRTDSLYKLRECIKSNLYSQLKRGNYTKSSSTFKLLGCSYKDLKLHLESQFKEGMSWQNHGEWHIDHVIPLSSAKTEEEFKKLWYYKNLQPLWAEENYNKKSLDNIKYNK